jgi:hypothetical protein
MNGSLLQFLKYHLLCWLQLFGHVSLLPEITLFLPINYSSSSKIILKCHLICKVIPNPFRKFMFKPTFICIAIKVVICTPMYLSQVKYHFSLPFLSSSFLCSFIPPCFYLSLPLFPSLKTSQ